jgi:hypothetical protein
MFKSTVNLKNDAAKALFDYVKSNHEHLYFFFGKSSSWGTDDIKPNLEEGVSLSSGILKDLILLYKFDRNALSLCYDRVNWVKHTIMAQYNSDNTSLKCYALTTKHHVYKCISNGNGSLGLYEPDHTTFDIKRYDDGYKWKYLYTLTTLERKAFLSDAKMPITLYSNINSVKHLTEFNAMPGTIDSYDIVDGGSGYSSNDNVTITGDGVGAGGKVFQQNGVIKNIIITNPGKGYTYANVDITTSTGIQAIVNANPSPLAGHGSNLIEELNVSSIMLNSKRLSAEQDVGPLPKIFDYRKVGLLSGIVGNKKELIPMCYKIQVETSVGFIANTSVKLNTGITCNIVHTETILGEHFIYLNEPDRPLTSTDFLNKTISTDDSSVTTRILDSLYIPTINKNFNVLYLENLDKSSVIDQELDILRIVIDF